MNNFSWLIECIINEEYPMLRKHIILFQNKYKNSVINDNTIQKYFIWIQLTNKDIKKLYFENSKDISLHYNDDKYNDFKLKCINAGILFNEFEIIIRFYLYKFVKKYYYINFI